MNRLSAVLIPLWLTTGLITALAATPTGAVELGDPTRPSGTVAAIAESGGWRLNATRITPNRRTAVINGIQVAEGGEIGGARVLRIGHAQVQLRSQGEILTLHLEPAEVKKAR